MLKASRRLLKGWRGEERVSAVSVWKKKKKIGSDSMSSTSRNIKIEGEASPRSQRIHVGDRRPVEVSKVERQASDVNEHAEAFIRRFRQQLMIQRLESLENLEKMLARGT
ncbi:uncharacterized protein [Aristolochia californica]|uniref:uncharacterized protein n=1 Tax=Aristolochia californica TaxID=171875 RepID=UPI0035D6C40E